MGKPQQRGERGRGRGPKEPKEYEEEVIQIDRVTRVVKGGRRLRFRATVAVGNKKGKVGIGIGKSTEVQGAIQKAISHAKKTVVQVPMVGQTIPHRINLKYKSAKLMLKPACPGTGIIAGGPLRKILELAGIQDVLGKCLGNNNKLINSQAAVRALSSLQPIPWIKTEQPEKQEEKGAKPKAQKSEKADAKNKKPDVKAEAKKTEKKPAEKSTKAAKPKKEEAKKT